MENQPDPGSLKRDLRPDASSASHVEDQPAGRKRRPWIGIVIVVLVIVVLAVLVARRPKGTPVNPLDQPQTATIKVATVTRGDIGLYVDALGTVTPLSTVNVYSQITGKVMAVNYREGQMVQKGQELIEIDPRPYEAQLEEAQGTLDHDRGLLAQAKIDLARYQKAAAQNAIARQTLEDQEQAVVQYSGTVKNDEGQVKYQQVQLSYCHLTAPASGRVGLRLVDPGNTIFAGSSNALVVITQLQPISVVFNVAEDDLDKVRSQITHRQTAQVLPVDVFDRSQTKKLASGKLLTLDNQIDTTTGTVRFRGQFDNRDLTLFPNQFVNTRLLVNTLRDVLLAPSAAVQRNGVQAFVYLVNGGKASVHNITELTSDGDVSAIEGINAGDVVSITGFDKLQDGTSVVVESSSDPTAVSTSGAVATGTLSGGQKGKAAAGGTR
jgi:multidrug efflux system membrane fusion protein